MCSGRFIRSGSVVYWSRTKPWNALPPRRSSLKPRRPEDASTTLPRFDLDACRRPLRPRRRERRDPRGLRRGFLRRRPAPLRPAGTWPGTFGQKPAIALEIGAREVHGLALDEVLHRVSGDEAGVIAGGVRGPERIAIDQHQHVGAKHRTLTLRHLAIAIQAIDDDVALAVVIALPAAGKSFQCEDLHAQAIVVSHAM